MSDNDTYEHTVVNQAGDTYRWVFAANEAVSRTGNDAQHKRRPQVKAYNDNPELKSLLVAKLAAHRQADRMIRGRYAVKIGNVFRGCGIGCAVECLNQRAGLTLPYNGHAELSRALEIPEHLLHLMDYFFEMLTYDHEHYPERFFGCIAVGADLSPVWPRYALWMLTDEECGVMPLAKESPAIVSGIRNVVDLYSRWPATTEAEWDAEESAEVWELAKAQCMRDAPSPPSPEWKAAMAAWLACAAGPEKGARSAWPAASWAAWPDRVEVLGEKLLEMIREAKP